MISRGLLLTLLGLALPLLSPGNSVSVAQHSEATTAELTVAGEEFPGPPDPRGQANYFAHPTEYLLFSRLLAVDARDHLASDLLKYVPSTANGLIQDGGKTIVLVLKPHLRWSSG